MAVLITGASGFLGTSLARHLRERGNEVVSLSSADADLRDPRSLSKYSGQKYDRIYHLAAWTQAGDFCLFHPGEQWLINQQINTSVLRWWAEEQPQAKLISIGTSCAYQEGRDLKEEYYLTGEPIADLYTYAMTKRMLYIGQQSLARQFGLKYLTVVPSTLYGPDYHVGAKQMHFIFDLAWKFLANKHYGDEIVLWGDGYQRRELVFVDDFVADLLLLDEKVENDIVNIGAGQDFSIREFAGVLCELLGIDPGSIRYDINRYVGAKEKYLNTEKEAALLGELKRIPLAQGLERTLVWLEPRFLELTGQRKAIKEKVR